MTAADINSVIDNLCQIFGVTVDRLAVEMSRAHIANSLAVILTCAVVILPWIVALVVGVKKHRGVSGFFDYVNDDGIAAITVIVGGFVVIIASIPLLANIPELAQWIASPLGSTIEVIARAIGG